MEISIPNDAIIGLSSLQPKKLDVLGVFALMIYSAHHRIARADL